jgi:hypothetical protein
MAATQLNQRYDMILGREWHQRSQARLEDQKLTWLKDISVTATNQN